MANKEPKIQLCHECKAFVFVGKTMTCGNGHPISIEKLTRDEVVPFYQILIENHINDSESQFVISFNNQILAKWKPSALIYIKDKAWKNIAKPKISKPFVFGI